MPRTICFSFLIILLVLPYSVIAQLNNPVTAGAIGLMMGGTGAVTSHSSSIFANPAGIGLSNEKSLLLQAENRFLLGSLNTVQAGFILPTETSRFGFRLRHFGTADYRDQEAALIYGRPLAKGLHLGGGLHLRQQRIPEFGSKQWITFSLGVQVQLIPSLTLGAMVFNPIRQKVTPNEFQPSILSVGIRYEPSEQIQLIAEVEKDIDFPARFKAGMEYKIGDILVLRTGIRTAPANFTFGVGIPVGKHITIDIGAWQHQQLGTSPLFNLRYQW